MTDPHDRHLSIGELSRASGLTVSALRFYDREGVLVPAEVDAATGYRRYSPVQVRAARLLAGMRRVQVPVAEMVAVLEAGGDADAAEDLLQGHLARLEHGLADARREVARLCRLVRGEEEGSRLVLHGPALTRALGSVAYAVGSDPGFPVLTGVLVERDGSGVQVVATDRYRLALARVDGALGGESSAVLLPAALVEELLATPPPGPVALAVDGAEVRVLGDDIDLRAPALEGDYPDYRALLPAGPTPADRVSVAGLRPELEHRRDRPRVRLGPDGRVLERSSSVDGATTGEVLVDTGYLWDAVQATSDGHLVLPGAGTLGPLAVYSADERVLGLVMPLAPDPQGAR